MNMLDKLYNHMIADNYDSFLSLYTAECYHDLLISRVYQNNRGNRKYHRYIRLMLEHYPTVQLIALIVYQGYESSQSINYFNRLNEKEKSLAMAPDTPLVKVAIDAQDINFFMHLIQGMKIEDYIGPVMLSRFENAQARILHPVEPTKPNIEMILSLFLESPQNYLEPYFVYMEKYYPGATGIMKDFKKNTMIEQDEFHRPLRKPMNQLNISVDAQKLLFRPRNNSYIAKKFENLYMVLQLQKDLTKKNPQNSRLSKI